MIEKPSHCTMMIKGRKFLFVIESIKSPTKMFMKQKVSKGIIASASAQVIIISFSRCPEKLHYEKYGKWTREYTKEVLFNWIPDGAIEIFVRQFLTQKKHHQGKMNSFVDIQNRYTQKKKCWKDCKFNWC